MVRKILFVNAINPFVEVEKRYPTLGLGYLISSIRSHFGTSIFEFKIINDNIEKEILHFKPHVVGITSVTQNFDIAKEYAKLCKSKDLRVIIGGIHISMLPQSLTPDMDIGVIGEGEKTIIDIFELLLKEDKFNEDALCNIKGIVYRSKDETLHFTEKRELITPLDNITLPARDLFTINKHSYLFSSRGCPYRCVFCASSRFWEKVRFFSASYVVEEIKELVNKYGVRVISFYDDLMMANLKRLKMMVELLNKEKLLGKVKFAVNARANLLTDEVVRLLKEINVVSVGLGLESGSNKTLHYLKGTNITVDHNIRAINNLKKYKITTNASFIIGSPYETKEEILSTLNFIKNSGLNFVDTYILTPFPGTPIWEYAKKAGLVGDDMEWDRLNVNFQSHHQKAIILSRTLSREELYNIFLKFQKERFRIAIKNLLRHPFLLDIPRALIRKCGEKLHFISLIKRNRFSNV